MMLQYLSFTVKHLQTHTLNASLGTHYIFIPGLRNASEA